MKKNLKIILIALWAVAGLTVGGVAAGVWWYRAVQRGSPENPNWHSVNEPDPHRLDPMYDAPPFTLTDQDGKPFGNAQLHGKVWVADFVFTTCTGLCPMMTEQMRAFQKATAGSAIQMVSFSVDPENDTPAVLAAYAVRNKADLSRWHFLTGNRDTLWTISNAMKLAVGPGDDHQVMHSSHFLLIDGNGHVRGVYDYKDAGFMDNLVTDARTLAADE